MVYLWQVRILRLAWLQDAAAWASIPILYSSYEPVYNLGPQVKQLHSARRPPATWLESLVICDITVVLLFIKCFVFW